MGCLFWSWDYEVSGVPVNSTCDPWSCNPCRIFLSVLIVSPSKKKKCVVSCSVCRILFGARTPQREFFSQSPAWQCCLSLLPSPIAVRVVPFMPRGVLWRQHVQAKLWLICVLVGIELSCPVALPKTPVSDAIMVTFLGARQHQGEGCEFQMSWKRSASNMSQMFGMLLVLLGLAKIVLPLARGKEKSLEAPWSCRGNLRFLVLPLVPRGDPW